jgi:predicted MPP superfamily phosphohydrolase
MSKPKDRKVTRRRVLQVSAGVLGTVLLDGLLIEPRWIQVERVSAPLKGLGPGLDGLKIAYMSDFHLGNWIEPGFVQKAIAMAKAEKPDMIILGGDFVHKDCDQAWTDIRPSFKGISAPMGVIATTGNHDYGSDVKRVVKELEAEDVDVLRDRRHRIERDGAALDLVGLDDWWFRGRTNPAGAFKGTDPNVPVLLLQHNPDAAEEMKVGRVDLQIAGHMHGGQVRYPWGHAPFTPSNYGEKFVQGFVQGLHHQVYVSRGIGGAGPLRPRFWARPEVTILTLRSA